MRIESKETCGHAGNGRPLLRRGVNEVDYASLPRHHREFVDAVVAARVAKILPDEPAEVIPIAAATEPERVDPGQRAADPPPTKVRRARRAG